MNKKPTIEDRISNFESMRSYLYEKYFGNMDFEDDLNDILEAIEARIVMLQCKKRLP